MAVSNPEKLQLFFEHFIIIFDFHDIFRHILDELDVIDFHEPLEDIIEDFFCGDGLQFTFQILLHTLCL